MLYAATGAQSFMIPFRPEHPSQPAPGPRSLTTVPCTAVWAQPSLLPTGLLTNQACSPAWPSLQRRTKSISVSHKSCLAQAPGIASEALLGGISTSMHGQAPHFLHRVSVRYQSFSSFLPVHHLLPSLPPHSSSLAHCGLFSIQNSGWTFSDIWQSCEGRTVRGLTL